MTVLVCQPCEMEMQTHIDLILHHASVRRYTTDPVPKETVETIIGAAQQASTSSNLQMYSVVAVTDPEKRAHLATLCGHQASIIEAPVFLAWCADLSRLDRVCELRGHSQVTRYVENFLVAAMDAAIVAQTAALAAESLGLGICYVGAIRNDPEGVVQLLHLPQLVFPIAGMTMGWPSVEPARKPRLPLAAVLRWETYDRHTEDADLAFYDQEMIATGIYEGRQVPLPGRPEMLEGYGWMEHSARRASQPARTALKKALRDQGFDLE
jgi:FMN reductase (NADPH)